MIRPICNTCNKNVCAPNYYKNNKRYWRKKCALCLIEDKKHKTNSIRIPRWKKKGYKKKSTCDLCGFKATYNSQILVFHIDGNLNNNELINLRSICLCCVEIVKRKNITWKIGDIVPDY